MKFKIRNLFSASIMTVLTVPSLANSSWELDAWGSFSGIQNLSQQVSLDKSGVLNFETLNPASRGLLKSHLGTVKKILISKGTSFVDRKTHLQISGGEDEIGRLAGRLGKTKLIYSPFELAAMGADAAYDDLKKEFFLSAEAAIGGYVDIASTHEYLHHQVSLGAFSHLPWAKLIFFVDQKGKALRKDAHYYGTFLRADEILAHLQDIICYAKIEDAEVAEQKAEVLKEILQTLRELTPKFSEAVKGSSTLRPGQEVLRVSHLRLDLNGVGLESLSSLEAFVVRLKTLAQQNKLDLLIAEGKKLKLGSYCPGHHWTK